MEAQCQAMWGGPFRMADILGDRRWLCHGGGARGRAPRTLNLFSQFPAGGEKPGGLRLPFGRVRGTNEASSAEAAGASS